MLRPSRAAWLALSLGTIAVCTAPPPAATKITTLDLVNSPRGLVDAVALTPDAMLLATGERAGAIHIWPTAGDPTPVSLASHKEAIADLAAVPASGCNRESACSNREFERRHGTPIEARRRVTSGANQEDGMRIGFIGLGNMGEPMAGFVLGARYSLVVHDVRRQAAAALLARGAVWADSAGEVAAQCDVICVCVPGPAEMKTVMLGPGGVLEGVRPGSVVIDHTTNAPAVVREVGTALRERDAHLLDAPLDGGREGALEGQLTVFVGGDETALQRVKPVLDTFARSVVWVGAVGAGSVTKIVHNALAMSIDLLLAECLTLGAKSGVALPRLVDAFRAGCIVSQNMTFTKRMPATLFRGDFAARFALALAHKDFRLAADLARQHGVPTRLLDLCEAELLEAMNRGWGGDDRTRASTLQEERAGVTLRL